MQPCPGSLCVLPLFRMSIQVTPKKRGRPATGKDPVRTVRLPDDVWDALNAMAEAAEQTRSEAIRNVLAKHLKAKGYLE